VSETQFERVLVVPTNCSTAGTLPGFNGDVARYLDELLRPENTSYRPRPRWSGTRFKQLIPYMIFRHIDARERRRFFSTRAHGHGRGPVAQQAERRHRRTYLGIDATSNGSGNPYEEGMRRDWRKRSPSTRPTPPDASA